MYIYFFAIFLKSGQGGTRAVLGTMADTDISVPIQAPPEQTMKKKFNFWTALGIALCCSGAWEGWVASMAQGIVAGGSVGLFWGWIFVSIGITFMACALAELVSMWPSAGGQYVWAAELAPKKYKAFISWYVAWLSIAGLWLGAVSCSMGVAVQTQSYVAITRSYDMKRWHAFLINVLVIVMWVVVNIFYVRAMHWMNESILYIHVVGYFVVIITLAVCTDNKHDAKYVFTNFENNSGWEQDGVAWCVSLLPALYAFFSLDTAAHYSEEITNADVAVPRAMYLQAVINSLMTIPFVITVLFCIGDPIDVLFNSQIGFTSPFTQIVLKSTGSPAAAIILNAISTYIAFAAGLDLWGATARAMWSLARDGGLPQLFSRIHPKYDVPIPAILVTLPPSLIIIMLYIFNSTAFYVRTLASYHIISQLDWRNKLTDWNLSLAGNHGRCSCGLPAVVRDSNRPPPLPRAQKVQPLPRSVVNGTIRGGMRHSGLDLWLFHDHRHVLPHISAGDGIYHELRRRHHWCYRHLRHGALFRLRTGSLCRTSHCFGCSAGGEQRGP
ncbi:hypothetical protein HRR80_007785 [Exophiala dermatitidis]|uniref:Amino acid transporter n=1 Tax=Exophiala dermatitidis TaxID=5970 RepID=A0AAN6ER92_EXODE|nr:hypothetical protein HRR77_007227 [Exophiala dermatitidis]KAJ4539927.1 hypothetical protein HRR76_003353 [Exophiala dermatitidis]KAJ4562482.1 hypothetical protein HRR79_006803 [Exophiala dermatitidis]KAJ4577549.1 hypothetical protein HRR82_005421 [Exophiala dermatitidis]KAJ4609339.1 hypothetical protein HRR85_006923 [Exophiala dermatitidis]